MWTFRYTQITNYTLLLAVSGPVKNHCLAMYLFDTLIKLYTCNIVPLYNFGEFKLHNLHNRGPNKFFSKRE